MKIKVEEYVRTKDGVIFKILTKDKSDFGNHYYGITDNENYSNYTYGKGSHNDIKNKILKHSFNIIDLIESIDILVFKIKGCDFISRGIVYEEYDASKGEFYYIVNGHRLEEIQIIKILTHEQYERDCFVVEEEE